MLIRQLPILNTTRLLLRPFEWSDSPLVQTYCNDRAIHEMTSTIPHPYTQADAEWWLNQHAIWLQKQEQAIFALVERNANLLVGTVGLILKPAHHSAEMGYWIGKPHWGKGYASEGAEEVLRFGFEELQLNRIFAEHFDKNPASGRVMQKIGLLYEGFSPDAVYKNEQFIGMYRYGLTKKAWAMGQALK